MIPIWKDLLSSKIKKLKNLPQEENVTPAYLEFFFKTTKWQNRTIFSLYIIIGLSIISIFTSIWGLFFLSMPLFVNTGNILFYVNTVLITLLITELTIFANEVLPQPDDYSQ